MDCLMSTPASRVPTLGLIPYVGLGAPTQTIRPTRASITPIDVIDRIDPGNVMPPKLLDAIGSWPCPAT
jgi:hypothetical protein